MEITSFCISTLFYNIFKYFNVYKKLFCYRYFNNAYQTNVLSWKYIFICAKFHNHVKTITFIMINNNRALTFICCINESGFHLYILYRARRKSLCTCAKRLLHCAGSEKIIYMCPGIVPFTTDSSAHSNFTLHPEWRPLVPIHSLWIPLSPTSHFWQVHRNLCSLYIIVVVIVSSLPINEINWPCQ